MFRLTCRPLPSMSHALKGKAHATSSQIRRDHSSSGDAERRNTMSRVAKESRYLKLRLYLIFKKPSFVLQTSPDPFLLRSRPQISSPIKQNKTKRQPLVPKANTKQTNKQTTTLIPPDPTALQELSQRSHPHIKEHTIQAQDAKALNRIISSQTYF